MAVWGGLEAVALLVMAVLRVVRRWWCCGAAARLMLGMALAVVPKVPRTTAPNAMRAARRRPVSLDRWVLQANP